VNRVLDKGIIVTGAARGIGRATAAAAVAEGAKVILTDIDQTLVEHTAYMIGVL